jgi:hypothetical protein
VPLLLLDSSAAGTGAGGEVDDGAGALRKLATLCPRIDANRSERPGCVGATDVVTPGGGGGGDGGELPCAGGGGGGGPLALGAGGGGGGGGGGEGEGEVEVVLGVVCHFEDGLEERAVSVVTGSGARL